MKILEVLDSFYPSIDGPVNCIVNIAKTLNEKGLAKVDILVPKYKKIVNIDGIDIFRCKSIKGPEGYYVGLPQFDRNVKNLIKWGGYDLIHVHSPFTIGRYVIYKSKKYNIPTLLTMHTKYKSDFERKLRTKTLQNFMMKYIMQGVNKADYVSSVSLGASQTVKDYGYKGNNVFIVRNGTDLKPIQVSQDLLEEIKLKHNLQNKFVFLFVGRIVKNKNIQFSLEVLKNLKEIGEKNFKFLIVGNGDYLNSLKELVKKYNLVKEVEFLGRISDREYLSAIYKSANLFLFPSEFDTCGIVAIEAAAMGIASAMIENTCASEVINNKENGLSLKFDAKIWAEELKNLINNKPLLQKMQKNALKTVYKSWEVVSLEYLDLYKKLVNESKSNKIKK